MTNDEIVIFAQWLKENEPVLNKNADTGEYWELFAYRIVDKLENTEEGMSDEIKRVAEEVEPFLSDRFAQCIREHSGQGRHEKSFDYAVPYAKDCIPFIDSLLLAERRKAYAECAQICEDNCFCANISADDDRECYVCQSANEIRRRMEGVC